MPVVFAIRHHLHARSVCTITPAAASKHGRVRRLSHATPQQQQQPVENGGLSVGEDEGALTRRLRDMSENAIESGGQDVLKAMDEGGFSAELKAQLEQRIAAASLPTVVSRHTRELTTAEPWSGTESVYDASLRMLNDAHKPLRLGRPPRMPGVRMPKSIDTGHKRVKEDPGRRLASARDRSTVYVSFREEEARDAAEREGRHQHFKDRYEPDAREVVPATVQGLASLANKRIEDAIARGQFQNIPRGRGTNVERDYNASSPFIDTTEYFMNKIIQRQEIVPPWIEKQQELASAASKFRSRMRADWKRHAARILASKGGSLQDQMKRADTFAQAELVANLSKHKSRVLPKVDHQVHLSQISLAGEPELTMEEMVQLEGTIIEKTPEENVVSDTLAETTPIDPAVTKDNTSASPPIDNSPTSSPPTSPTSPYPFRDPDWERIELAYHTVAIKDLNDKARSYNLQAPELAKRPYFNLQRELNSCYADVAPQLARAILDRARKPVAKVDAFQMSRQQVMLGSIIGGPVRVRDERSEKQYGFKQFWRDLWVEKPPSAY